MKRQRISATAPSPQSSELNTSQLIGTALQIAPSGIDELPLVNQASVFFGIYTLLGASTYLSVQAIDYLSKSIIGLENWRNNFVDTSLPLLLGILYLAAGAGHFVSMGSFCDIYPPRGTWGIWYLPGSAEFHVTWTGIVEMLGGGGLLFGAGQSLLKGEDEDEEWLVKLARPSSAAALFLLTALVTPANIYMYTHGATMGEGMLPLDVSFHYARFGFQVAFMSLLFVLAKDSFFFAWGDELD